MKKRSRQDSGYLMEAAETSTLCRFYINCFLCEMYYLQYFCANDFREKVSIERHLNSILNLDKARAEGLIDNWSIQWHWTSSKEYPRTPLRIYIRLLPSVQSKLVLPRPLLKEFARIREQGLNIPFADMTCPDLSNSL